MCFKGGGGGGRGEGEGKGTTGGELTWRSVGFSAFTMSTHPASVRSRRFCVKSSLRNLF